MRYSLYLITISVDGVSASTSILLHDPLILNKKNIALETLLVDNPRKYKCKLDSIYNEDVLFLLLIIIEIEHLLAIGLLLG